MSFSDRQKLDLKRHDDVTFPALAACKRKTSPASLDLNFLKIKSFR